MALWAVEGDPCIDGSGEIIEGALIATNPRTITINNIPLIVHSPEHAEPDIYCPKPLHCDPMTDEGSANVFAYGLPAHCDGQRRITGIEFTTLVINQNSVFVNQEDEEE